jgi:DNA polymerase-3 subunit alpha
VHNHSEFSALDGFSTVEQIADRLVEADLKGAFLTDHGVVAGWRPFHKALAKRDLFAGFGMEAYQARESRHQRGKARDASHLVLLAKNAVGIKNLMLMNYHAYESGSHYVARIERAFSAPPPVWPDWWLRAL